MSTCDSVGMVRNCGPDCLVYLEGDCIVPEEMEERLIDREEKY